MAHDDLNSLLDNLRRTRKVYSGLLDVAGRKQAHIVGNDIESLRDDLRMEEGLAREGARLNGLREDVHRQCRRALNAGQGAGTLEELCSFMPSSWRDRFESERIELRRVLHDLQHVNRVNVALVNNSLELMDGLLAALFNAEPAATYGPRGLRARNAVNARALDATA